jgi:hypothetical protein
MDKKNNVIQFPKSYLPSDKTKQLQARLDEIETENKYITDDIEYLEGALQSNVKEAQMILKEFAVTNGKLLDKYRHNMNKEEYDEVKDAIEEGLENLNPFIEDILESLKNSLESITEDIKDNNPKNEE